MRIVNFTLNNCWNLLSWKY